MITSVQKYAPLASLLFLFSLTAACGPDGSSGDGDDDDGSVPSILSISPADGETDIALNGSIRVTFSEAMDPATLDDSTFVVTMGAAPVAGTVVYLDEVAVFWPSAHFASNASISVTITEDVQSALGVPIDDEFAIGFATGMLLAPGLPVNLGTAGGFAILAKSGISTVPTSAVTGDVGVSPAAASYITGFSLIADSTNVFSTSTQVTGQVFAADYASPSPANLTTAISNMETAFTDAAGRAPDVTELGAGNIGGMTLAPGVYKWGTGLLIPTDLTLDGNATAVWIFQIAQDLTVASATSVLLTGGAVPENVFWQVSGSVDIGTTAHLEGIILSQTAITLQTGSTIDGRLLAQTAIDIDGSTVVEPAQ